MGGRRHLDDDLISFAFLRRLEFFKSVLDLAGRHTLLGNLETMSPTAAA
jgi:hypothetical protein